MTDKKKSYYTKLKFYDLDKKAYFTLSLGPKEVSNIKFIEGLALSRGHHSFRWVTTPVKKLEPADHLSREDFNFMVDVLLFEDKGKPVVRFKPVSTILPRKDLT